MTIDRDRVRRGWGEIRSGARNMAHGLDTLVQEGEKYSDPILTLVAANAGTGYALTELIANTTPAAPSHMFLAASIGAATAGMNYVVTRPPVREFAQRTAERINSWRPAGWMKNIGLCVAIGVASVGMWNNSQDMRIGVDPVAIEESADNSTIPTTPQPTPTSPARLHITPDLEVVALTGSHPLTARPSIYDTLSFTPNHSIEYPGVRLEDKDKKVGRLQRTLRYEPIIDAIETKYSIERGILAGMMMQESYGNPLLPNSGGDGGFGIAHIQCKTARDMGAKTLNPCDMSRYHDPRHGAAITAMLRECGNDLDCISERYPQEERAHIIKNLDTAARIVADGKRRHGSWDAGIKVYRGGSSRARRTYLSRVNEFQKVWNDTGARVRAGAEFDRMNSGRFLWTDYLADFHTHNLDWGLEEYARWTG